MKNCLNILLLCLSLMMGCQYNKCLDCDPETVKIKKAEQALKKDPAKVAAAHANRLTTLREQIRQTPLFEVWHHRFQEDKIRNVYVVNELVLVALQSKQLFAMDRKSGYPQWVYQLDEYLDFPPEAYKDKLYLLSMGVLHILDGKTGSVLCKKNLEFVPSSPLCASDQFLYVGAWDNFIYALNMKTGESEWRYRIDGYVWGRPAVIDGYLFVAGTDERIYAINAQSGNTIKDWGQEGRYTTRAANLVAIVAPANKPILYAGSRDYNCYSLTRTYGELRWKFESGGEITRTPYLLGKSLYLVSDRELNKDSELYVLDEETGQTKWAIEHGKQLLFQGKQYDWVLLQGKKVVATDSKSGKLAHNFDFPQFEIYTTNLQDNLGYLGTKDGFLFAVEER